MGRFLKNLEIAKVSSVKKKKKTIDMDDLHLKSTISA